MQALCPSIWCICQKLARSFGLSLFVARNFVKCVSVCILFCISKLVPVSLCSVLSFDNKAMANEFQIFKIKKKPMKKHKKAYGR